MFVARSGGTPESDLQKLSQQSYALATAICANATGVPVGSPTT